MWCCRVRVKHIDNMYSVYVNFVMVIWVVCDVYVNSVIYAIYVNFGYWKINLEIYINFELLYQVPHSVHVLATLPIVYVYRVPPLGTFCTECLFVPSVTTKNTQYNNLPSVYGCRVSPWNTRYILIICTECLFVPSVTTRNTRYNTCYMYRVDVLSRVRVLLHSVQNISWVFFYRVSTLGVVVRYRWIRASSCISYRVLVSTECFENTWYTLQYTECLAFTECHEELYPGNTYRVFCPECHTR
jgi:hypothetical protein